MAYSTSGRFLRSVVFHCCLNGILSQHGAVYLHRRQPSQGIDNVLLGVRADLVDGGACHHFRQHRPSGNRRRTSESLEAGRHNATIPNLQVQVQHIPTGRILGHTDSVRFIENTDVARILVVIQNGVVVQAQGDALRNRRLNPPVGVTNISLGMPCVNHPKTPIKSIRNNALEHKKGSLLATSRLEIDASTSAFAVLPESLRHLNEVPHDSLTSNLLDQAVEGF